MLPDYHPCQVRVLEMPDKGRLLCATPPLRMSRQPFRLALNGRDFVSRATLEPAHYLLPYYLPRTTYYLLRTAHHVLLTTLCLLLTNYLLPGEQRHLWPKRPRPPPVGRGRGLPLLPAAPHACLAHGCTHCGRHAGEPKLYPGSRPSPNRIPIPDPNPNPIPTPTPNPNPNQVTLTGEGFETFDNSATSARCRVVGDDSAWCEYYDEPLLQVGVIGLGSG